jgi:hypothetical protein
MALSKSSAARPRAKISKKQRIYREARHLVECLADIDMQVKAGKLPERTAMIYALWSVEDFLRLLGYHGGVLYQLHLDLGALKHSVTTPTLKADKKAAGRKPDSIHVQELKGRLAGIARLQMSLGMSRHGAAVWVARNIPSELASRLSSKSFITTRAVKEYMDQYDCGPKLLTKFEQSRERQAFEDRTRRSDDNHFPTEQIKFLRAQVPPKKMDMHRRRGTNPLGGLFGFAFQIYIGALFLAEGINPPCEDLIKELERIAVERIPEPRLSTEPSYS